MKKYFIIVIAAVALMSASQQDSAITKDILYVSVLFISILVQFHVSYCCMVVNLGGQHVGKYNNYFLSL